MEEEAKAINAYVMASEKRRQSDIEAKEHELAELKSYLGPEISVTIEKKKGQKHARPLEQQLADAREVARVNAKIVEKKDDFEVPEVTEKETPSTEDVAANKEKWGYAG